MVGSPLLGCVQDTSTARRETAADSPASPCPLFGVVMLRVKRRYSLLDCHRQITPSNTELAVCLDVLGLDWPFLMLLLASLS